MNSRLLSLQAVFVFLLSLTLGFPRVAHGGNEAPPFLLQAARAWEMAELDKAAKLYDEAIKEGDLYPADVLVAYARIGTVHAAQNRADAALRAFRVAARLDPSFELPSEAGRIAQKIYKKAQNDAQGQGGKLEITTEVPRRGAPGAPFVVVANIAEAFVPLVVFFGITVQDPAISTSTLRPWTGRKSAGTKVEFEVPGQLVVAGANLLVRIDALDSYGNRWASTQARVQVGSQPSAGGLSPDDRFVDKAGRNKKEGGGFWASPWPWIIGGAVIVGGTVALVMSRPNDDVSVNAPAWK